VGISSSVRAAVSICRVAAKLRPSSSRAGREPGGGAVAPTKAPAGVSRQDKRAGRFVSCSFSRPYFWGSFAKCCGHRPRRRTVRAEYRGQSLCGGLWTSMLAAALVGVAPRRSDLFWLTQTAQKALIGSMPVNGLVRDLAPSSVGLIVLGPKWHGHVGGVRSLAGLCAYSLGAVVATLAETAANGSR
jgi:hypothetical protein